MLVEELMENEISIVYEKGLLKNDYTMVAMKNMGRIHVISIITDKGDVYSSYSPETHDIWIKNGSKVNTEKCTVFGIEYSLSLLNGITHLTKNVDGKIMTTAINMDEDLDERRVIKGTEIINHSKCKPKLKEEWVALKDSHPDPKNSIELDICGEFYLAYVYMNGVTLMINVQGAEDLNGPLELVNPAILWKYCRGIGGEHE